ncbi:hypothetical protein PAXINDRAFT_19244 [Paxillus involutus ATCC 200175]|uniref:Uncharacterized protein n=1 Tax=Paxillus involutus ATCC 200175 TaxID=664439 RepID=A0A0C9SNA3_PAXIN|nr:hypothetical protein PAXINDRAFT_19244 [Paxillus involutus ATCC 200175]
MPNQLRLIQIYTASKRRISGFALVDHTNAFNRTVPSVESTAEWHSEWETWMGGLFRVLEDTKEQGDCLEIPYDVSQAIAMAEVAYTNLEASVESTAEWHSEWETWMGGLFRVLEDTKEQGDCLEIPYDVSQAIAMAEVAYTNLEGRAEAERARELRGRRRQDEVEEGSSQVGGKGKRGGDRHA